MINHTCAVVIVHGKSEYRMVSAIKSKLRLNLVIYAHDKGKSSIQVDGLAKELTNTVFKSQKKLLEAYDTIDVEDDVLQDFRIFTIMDVDDVSDQSKRTNYIAGHISGIGNHPLKAYIWPIYCDENFEDVLREADFEFVAQSNRQKKHYNEVFSPGHWPATEENVREMATRLERSKKTNLDVFLNYCLDHKFKLSD